MAAQTAQLTDEEIRIFSRLAADYPHYANKCLTVVSKEGAYVPFQFNRAQKYVHDLLEKQKRETGRVRALILKGRQQGISTLVSGRFYHQVTHRIGCRCFILSHEQRSADTLYDIVARFHGHCPPLVRPETGAANAKELFFPKLDSGYEVATAGARETGRSKTIHLFHGSEVAFWLSAAGHFAASVQAVPDLPGTEVILESTANGIGNEFHKRWQRAEAGTSDYMAIFVPWYWQDEYQRDPPPGFELTSEEREYQEAYGTTLAQMAWRRYKIEELGDELLFMQEYPANSAEAFQMSGHNSFIPAKLVLKARMNNIDNPVGDMIIGVDPARNSEDREADDFAIAWRIGRKVLKVERKHITDVIDGANWVKRVIDEDEPARVFIDAGGLGIGTYDLLRDWGYADGTGGKRIVRSLNFGSEAMEPDRWGSDGKKLPGPKNRRAELWMASRDWLADPGGADIPLDDSLQADALAPSYRYDSNQRLQLESKEKLRSKGIRSPDGWDAVVCTFAEPVRPQRTTQESTRDHRREFGYVSANRSLSWMA